MIDQQLKDMIENIAEAERAAGTRVDINYWIPHVAVIRDGDTVYSFQEWQAQELLDKVPEGISDKDYILFSQTDW